MDSRLIRYLSTLGVGEDALDGWAVTVAQRDGVDCGFVIVKGTEVHILPFADGAMTRKNIREAMAPILDAYGFITTRVPLAETDHRLRRVLGFEHLWSDHAFSYWAATALPFSRKTHV